MKEKKAFVKIILAIVILIQMVYTVYVFWNLKEGSMSDETWSYGLANSYYAPFFTFRQGVYSSESSLDDDINYNIWISGDILRNYITVQPGEKFSYGSVYYNNKFDVHPPLYYMLIHTICSLFPNRFSWWYGLGLNLLFLVGTQLFLYLAVLKITGKEWKAFLVCMFYAASKGALFTFSFVRQYALLTMLCVMFVYFSACFYEEVFLKGRGTYRTVIVTALIAVLTFLTHYYGICFIGIFTMFFCLHLFCKGKWKNALGYGMGMLAALAILFALWPVAYSHIFVHGNRDLILYYPPKTQFRMLLHDLLRYNFGVTIHIFPTAFWNITIPLILAFVIAGCMLLFPFRHEKWFPDLMERIRRTVVSFGAFLKSANYIPVFTVISAVVILEVVAHTVDVYGNGHLSMRYSFVTVPFIVMVAVLLMCRILEKIFGSRRTLTVIAAVMAGGCLLVRVHLTTDYLFDFKTYGLTEEIDKMTSGKNVLVVDRINISYPITAVFFTPYLREAEQVCFSSGMSFPECVATEGFAESHVDYVFVDYNCFKLSDEETQMFISWLTGGNNEENGETAQVERDQTEGGQMVEFTEDSKENAPEKAMEVGKDQVDLDQTQLIKELNCGESYNFIGALYGQQGFYYVLQFE